MQPRLASGQGMDSTIPNTQAVHAFKERFYQHKPTSQYKSALDE